MIKREYVREEKEKVPVVAICYDFDKTLSPDDMQSQGFIQSVGHNTKKFWEFSNGMAEENGMDQNLAYMFAMKEASEGQILFTKDKLKEFGTSVALFPGAKEWFNRICEYGLMRNVKVEHYIISSGLKEMIEGTSVAKAGVFKRIYASSFYYNENGVAVWPAQVVNYTNKTQFLFRIEKGTLDVNDPAVNDYIAPEDVRVHFRNMIYIGDSDTDIPCMKLINAKGGYSIGVFDSDTGDKTKVYKMMRDGRIKYFAPADYSEGSELDLLVKAIIDRTSINERLEEQYYQCNAERIEADREMSEEEMLKGELIVALKNSGSFAQTHTVISSLNNIQYWTENERELLCKIGVENSQVRLILQDMDVEEFYNRILKGMHTLSENAEEIAEIIKQ